MKGTIMIDEVKKPPDLPADFWRVVANVTTMRREVLTSLFDRTGKDIDKECGYPTTLTITDYKNLYDRLGLAARIVELWPDECWALPPAVYETEDQDQETEFEKQWQILQDTFCVWNYLHRIDVLSGIGQFGILLVGIDDGKELQEPAAGLDPVTGIVSGDGSVARKLLYLRAFDESVVTISDYEQDVRSPRFGYPKTYRVNFTAEPGQATVEERPIHWSRVIHVADNRSTSEVFGVPRLRNVYNHLYDVKKVSGGSGEMFWKGGFPGYSFELNPEVASKVEAVNWESIKEQVTLYQQGLQRWFGVTGMVVKSLAPQVADPAGHVEMFVKLIALAKGVPWRMLLGSEEARIASVEDKHTWNTRLAYRQNGYLTPWLIRPFVDRLIALRILPRPTQYVVEWPDLNTPTEADQAKVAGIQTEALAKYVAGNVDQLIPPKEYLTLIQKLSGEEVEAIEDAMNAWEPEQPEQPEELPAGEPEEDEVLPETE